MVSVQNHFISLLHIISIMNMSTKHVEIPEHKNPFSRKWKSQTEFLNTFTGLELSTPVNTSDNIMTSNMEDKRNRRKVVKRYSTVPLKLPLNKK